MSEWQRTAFEQRQKAQPFSADVLEAAGIKVRTIDA